MAKAAELILRTLDAHLTGPAYLRLIGGREQCRPVVSVASQPRVLQLLR